MLAPVELHKPGLVVHLGDHARDTDILKEKFPQIKIISVAGNCDFLSSLPEIEIIKIEGVTLYITHGHQHGVKRGIHRLAQSAAAVGASVALYGHTHVPGDETYRGIRCVNPGSPHCPRSGSEASYGIMLITGSAVDVAVVQVG